MKWFYNGSRLIGVSSHQPNTSFNLLIILVVFHVGIETRIAQYIAQECRTYTVVLLYSIGSQHHLSDEEILGT
jgi:hypothetical protein